MENIKKIAIEEGAFKVAVADMKEYLPEKLKDYRYGISISVPLTKGIMKNVKESPTFEYFHNYRTINRIIDDITFKIANYIEKKGFMAYPIAASQSIKGEDYGGVFSHKAVATRSGIGFIGKSALLITEEYGSAVRFGTVFTNMDFEECGEPINTNKCGNCNICVEKCPAKAIKGVNWEFGMKREELFDAKACSEYMKEKYKDIGRGVVCGLCIRHCPYTKL